MLGASELPLRRGFACGKTLVRRKGAAGQKAGFPVLLLMAHELEQLILSVLCKSEQALYRLPRLFLQKSERAHTAAPPFQTATAYPQGARRIRKAAEPPTAAQALGCGLVLGAGLRLLRLFRQ